MILSEDRKEILRKMIEKQDSEIHNLLSTGNRYASGNRSNTKSVKTTTTEELSPEYLDDTSDRPPFNVKLYSNERENKMFNLNPTDTQITADYGVVDVLYPENDKAYSFKATEADIKEIREAATDGEDVYIVVNAHMHTGKIGMQVVKYSGTSYTRNQMFTSDEIIQKFEMATQWVVSVVRAEGYINLLRNARAAQLLDRQIEAEAKKAEEEAHLRKLAESSPAIADLLKKKEELKNGTLDVELIEQK